MSSNLKHAIRLLVAFFVVSLSVQPVAASGETSDLEAPTAQATTSEKDETGLDSQAGDCNSDLAAASTGIDFANLDFGKQLERENVSSCTYTCPNGWAALCPDRLGHSKTCVNGCCQWVPQCLGSCETPFDCPPHLVCNGSTNCCTEP